jgi:hypothetical protein
MLEREFYNALLKDNSVQKIGEAGDIYYNNIIQARIEALIDIFPAVTACVSEDYMRHVAYDYCRKHDAVGGNLNLYGDNFGAYLGSLSECQKYAYIRDLADFEYCIRRLLYSVDENHLLAENFIHAIQAEKSPLLPQSTLGFSSCYPIADIADFCLGKTEAMPDINKKLYHYFLHRDTDTQGIFVKSITAHDMEIIPILKTQGVLGLSDTVITIESVAMFIQFLTAKNLWIV